MPLSVIQSGSVDELNYLASLLEMQRDEDKGKFAAAVTLGEYAGSVKDLINLVQNLDCYWIYPTVQSEKDYGYYLIDELDELELPEEAKKYFMYEEYGRDAVAHDGGRFTEQGYIYNNKNTFSEWYNGRENDIPGEYRIMSYPQPPSRPGPEKADFDAISTGQAATLTAEPPQPRPVVPIVLTSEKPTEKIKEITDRLEQGITELFDSERYKEYLRVMSRFHNYSFNNTLLIAMQKPDASLVAGFSSWKNTHGRNVKRGEKGIKILAPSPYKIRREMEKIDPQTQQPVIGKDGKPVTEEREITIPAYKVVSVFDVSQTEGRELPDIAVDELAGDVDRYKDFFAALEKTSPVPIGFENIEGKSHGYYHLEEKRIAIQEGMSELQTLKTAIHEIAHAKLHDIDLNAPKEDLADRPDRRTREVQAESVAYTVCQHYGLDTSDYSFGYVAGWSSGRELAELKASLETIRATAAEIIDSIDGHFAELQQAREQTAQQEQPQPGFEQWSEPADPDNGPDNPGEPSDDVAAYLPEQDKPPQEAAPDLAAEPTVTIIWSESAGLREGETMPLSRANALFASLDEAELASPGYDKTKFAIDCVFDGEADHYEGRQDFGDGDGSLIDHIEKYHAHYENNADWENHLLHTEGNGFRWSPKEGAWQRQLTTNAYYAADYVKAIAPITGEKPTELQRAHIRAQKQQAVQTPQEQPAAEAPAPEQAQPQTQDTFSIYQLKRGDETRDFRFEPYDRLQAAGLAVDPANYDLIYTAPLAPDMSLDDIFTRFNIDHPADFKGHSLSVSDVVVLHQAGQDTAHYVDSVGYQQVPEFLREQQELTPDARMTGEQIKTPRGSFRVTDMTREQMEAAGYGFHHQSEDGKYFIMGNGTRAFAVAATQPESPIKHIEDAVEQNDNSFDGIINNTPPPPTVDELEAKVQAGEQISLLDLADAIKADKERGGGTPEKKPSIRAQLKADKERAAQKKTAAKTKSQDLERS